MACVGKTSFTSFSVRRFKTCKINCTAITHSRFFNGDNEINTGIILIEEKDQVEQREEHLTEQLNSGPHSSEKQQEVGMSTISMAMKVHNKVEQLPAACWTTNLGILGLAGTSSPKIYCALA